MRTAWFNSLDENPAGGSTMAIQLTNHSRFLTRSVSGWIGLVIFSAGLVVVGQAVIAQTIPDELLTQDESATPVQTVSAQVGLKQVVRIVIEPGTNRILLVGSKEDVAIVLRTLNSIKAGMNSIADPTVTEKVVLKSQLADTVASIMSSSLSVHDPGGPKVKINAVHFPEAILLSGPASAVKRAKQLLATIDRYEGLSDSDTPTQKRIY